VELYRSLAANYDWLRPKEEALKQRPFFEKLIADHQLTSCLDCACGTGWHLALLDDLGLQVSGSDLADGMLNVAMKNLEGRNIPLKRADFRALDAAWREQFDMVICMTTSFPYMLDDESAAQALKSMVDRLNAGGVLVIDNGFSDAFFDEKPKFIPAQVYHDRAFYFIFEYPQPDRVLVNILYIEHNEEGMHHHFDTHVYNPMRLADMQRYFAATHYSHVEYYGNHEWEPYSTESSRRMVAVAHR
jgi:glycine/sarcosine N-methyltransferase